MRLAFISDIHGNLLALEAVLSDVARRKVDRIIDLGDVVSGPLWPRETFERLAAAGISGVRGNHDRRLVAGGGSWERLAQQELTADQCSALAERPPLLSIGADILAFHATPGDDETYLLEDVAHGTLMPADVATVLNRLGPRQPHVLLCGHSHQQRVVTAGPHLIINPGSVGCPAYKDPTAPVHCSEAGSPHARYAIVDDASGEWRVEMLAVTYDWSKAAAQARAHNQPLWAIALETGRMP